MLRLSATLWDTVIWRLSGREKHMLQCELNSTAEDERKYRADSLQSSVQHVCLPSGMHVHCNQHRRVHCVSPAQPLICTVTWGSGVQLYILVPLLPAATVPACRPTSDLMASGYSSSQGPRGYSLWSCWWGFGKGGIFDMTISLNTILSWEINQSR